MIFLVGYMGCGKTSLARKLAGRLGYTFVDTDEKIEESEGAAITDIFRYEGEEYFRKAERKLLDRLIAEGGDVVVATGGGLPAWSDNMERMNAAGRTVYVRRTPARIAARLTPYGRQKRPRLRGLDDAQLLEFMTRHLAEREPFYAKAGLIVDATHLSDEEVVKKIMLDAPSTSLGSSSLLPDKDSGRSSILHSPLTSLRSSSSSSLGKDCEQPLPSLLRRSSILNSPIGVYDSGLGGLTVWREIRRLLPHESLVYLGDGKSCPYGSRPAEEIRQLADEAVKTLIDNGCKMVVVACNTATAAAIDFLRDKYRHIPIVGMEPAVKPACANTKTGVIGVLATAQSLEGDLFHRTAAQYGRDVEVLTAVGEGFVELVEQNREETPEALEAVRRVLVPLLEKNVDQIVLGCTHYPFLIPAMQKVIENGEWRIENYSSFHSQFSILHSQLTIIDPSPAVARRVAQLLQEHRLQADEHHTARYEFITFADEAYRRKLERKAHV